jgi:glutathione reductase (NADPH)
MAKFDYDLFVIGAGSGGVRAARLAAMSGARVAVAEEDRVGGTCVVRGCVPKKFMVYASEFSSAFKAAEGYGWSKVESKFDWPTFLTAKDIEISRLSGVYVTNLRNAGADLAHARAVLTDAHTIALADRDKPVTAGKVLIATGGRPVKPSHIPGIDLAITSNEAFHLPQLPKRILIVGGGYIAVEFAGIFNGLGVETTLMYRGANILRGFDDDVRTHVASEMERRGITIILSCEHTRLEQVPGGVKSTFASGHELETDVVMYATGREPYTQGLGLDAAGVTVNEKGAVAVDAYSKTNVDNIWAVGDVTDRINLTPVAIREGAAFAETEFYQRPTSFDHEMVASAVFSQPPVGAVGLTEADARQDRYLPRRLPADEIHLLRRPGADADEAGGGGRHRQAARLPHRRPRRPGNDPDGRHRAQDGRHQGSMGRHLRRPPDRRRGAGDHAREVRAAGIGDELGCGQDLTVCRIHAGSER